MKLIDKNVSGVWWNFGSRHLSHLLKYGAYYISVMNVDYRLTIAALS